MAKPEFASVLDMTSSDIDRPQPLPPGHYTTLIRDRYTTDKSSKKETPYIRFILYPVETHPDVDEEQLEKVLMRANGERKKLSDIPIQATFWDTDEARWRLHKFLTVDLQIKDEGQTIGQMCEEATGCEVVAHVKHRTNDGNTFAELVATSPVKPPESKKTAARR